MNNTAIKLKDELTPMTDKEFEQKLRNVGVKIERVKVSHPITTSSPKNTKTLDSKQSYCSDAEVA